MIINGPIDVIGDTHGHNDPIFNWIDNSRTNTLIHVGDFGAGFRDYTPKLPRIGSLLNNRNKTIIVIRGNHDDPEYYDDRLYGGEYGGLKLIKDGTILKWNNTASYKQDKPVSNIMLRGGALSVDRDRRTLDLTYWSSENFNPTPSVEDHIDYVITHTAPRAVHGLTTNAYVKSFFNNDTLLEEDLNRESEDLQGWIDGIIDSQDTPPVSWHYGHFHQSKTTDYRGIKCTMLNINEITSLT
jgi:hypothetical protein